MIIPTRAFSSLYPEKMDYARLISSKNHFAEYASGHTIENTWKITADVMQFLEMQSNNYFKL